MSFKQKVFTKKVKTPLYKKPLFLSLAALLVLAGVFAALEITGVINVFKDSNPGLATQPTTPNRTGGVNTKGDPEGIEPQPEPAANEGDTKLSPGDTATGTLSAPTGNFVSNHHPTIGEAPDMQSNCTTTSGATCTIVFTKGTETHELPVQNTDREGAAYWSWSVKDKSIGLSAGSWKVQAKAVLGNQVKTADDALMLEIKP
jgi:hypothetical protein